MAHVLKLPYLKDSLRLIYELSLNSKNWRLIKKDKDMFFKLFIHSMNENLDPFLSGIVFNMVLNLKKECNFIDFPITEIGIGCKDASLEDWKHTDIMSNNFCRIFTILNEDWNYEKYGGSFILKDKEFKLNFGEFLIFDPGIIHSGGKILQNKKRFTLDISLIKNDYF